MPANAMGRRATVVIPPPTQKKNDPASADAGTEFKSIMKETSEPTKTAKSPAAGQTKAKAPAAEKAMVTPASENEAPAADVLDAEAAGQVAATTTEGESGGEAMPSLPEQVALGLLSEESMAEGLEAASSLVSTELTPVSSVLDEFADSARVLESGELTAGGGPEVAGLTEELLAHVVSSAGQTAVGIDSEATELTPIRLGEAVKAAADQGAQTVGRSGSANSVANSGSPALDMNPALLSEDAGTKAQQAGAFEGESLDLGTDPFEEGLDQRTRSTETPRVRAATAAGTAPTAPLGNDPVIQPSSRIPQGLESVKMGLAEQDPLEGSVNINGIRGARLAVPMGDGSILRGRLDLTDNSLDVALRASEEVGLRADQRVGDLREALAEHGIDLGEFDVSTDADENAAAGEGDEPGDAQENDARGENSAEDLEAQLEELRAGNGFGYYDEGGPGALINRRL